MLFDQAFSRHAENIELGISTMGDFCITVLWQHEIETKHGFCETLVHEILNEILEFSWTYVIEATEALSTHLHMPDPRFRATPCNFLDPFVFLAFELRRLCHDQRDVLASNKLLYSAFPKLCQLCKTDAFCCMEISSMDQKDKQDKPANNAKHTHICAVVSDRKHHNASDAVPSDANRKQGTSRNGMREATPHRLRQSETHSNFSVWDYQSAILQLANGGDPVTAHRWLKGGIDAGFVPQVELFNAVIGSYVQAEQLTQARQVASEMLLAGLEFDTSTYWIFMEAWRRAGYHSQVQLWAKKMLAQGLQPDAAIFGLVLPACATAGLLEDLNEWFNLSQDIGLVVDGTTLYAVVWVFAEKEDPINAMKWLSFMVNQGMQPDAQCFMGVLSSILKTRDVALAHDLIDQMRVANMQLDSSVFTRCIVVAIQSRQNSKAQLLADECVACTGSLEYPARQALRAAGLRVPRFGSKGGRPLQKHYQLPRSWTA